MTNRRFTPVQRRIITLVGAKQKFKGTLAEEQLPASIIWMMEAIEHLLLLEMERIAIADNVDVEDNFVEFMQQCGLEEMNEAEEESERKAGKTN